MQTTGLQLGTSGGSIHFICSHFMDKRRVMVMGVGPDQNTILPDIFFFASKKSSLDNENWKSLITESNKKKLRIPEAIISLNFLSLRKRKPEMTLRKRHRISRWLYCSSMLSEPREVRHPK